MDVDAARQVGGPALVLGAIHAEVDSQASRVIAQFIAASATRAALAVRRAVLPLLVVVSGLVLLRLLPPPRCHRRAGLAAQCALLCRGSTHGVRMRRASRRSSCTISRAAPSRRTRSWGA